MRLKLFVSVLLFMAVNVFATHPTPTASGQRQNFSQFTAPETTVSINVIQDVQHTCQIIVAAINTSVTVRAEGSLDGLSWFNLSPTNTDLIITSNGTYGMKSSIYIKYWRFIYVSQAGGATATVTVSYLVGAM